MFGIPMNKIRLLLHYHDKATYAIRFGMSGAAPMLLAELESIRWYDVIRGNTWV